MNKRNSIAILCLITLFSLILRVIYFYLNPIINRDGIKYLNIVHQWQESGIYPQQNYLPFYPWLIKAVGGLGLDYYHSAIIINITVGVMLSLVTYEIAYIIFNNKKIAIISAFLMAIHPSAIELSTLLIRDILYLFFSGIFIWLILLGIKKHILWAWVISGICFGIAFTTRYETLAFVPVLLGIFIYAILNNRHAAKTIFKNATLCFFSSLATIYFILYSLNVESVVCKSFTFMIQRTFNALM